MERAILARIGQPDPVGNAVRTERDEPDVTDINDGRAERTMTYGARNVGTRRTDDSFSFSTKGAR